MSGDEQPMYEPCGLPLIVKRSTGMYQFARCLTAAVQLKTCLTLNALTVMLLQMLSNETIFTARWCAIARYILWPCVRLSRVLSEQLNVSPHKHRRTIAMDSSFLKLKILMKIHGVNPNRVAKYTWRRKNSRFSTSPVFSSSDSVPPSICVHPPPYDESTLAEQFVVLSSRFDHPCFVYNNDGRRLTLWSVLISGTELSWIGSSYF